MSLSNTIKSDESLTKWLKYGFRYITGCICDDVDLIITNLKAFRNMDDNDIMRLCNATYDLGGIHMPS